MEEEDCYDTDINTEDNSVAGDFIASGINCILKDPACPSNVTWSSKCICGFQFAL